MVVSDLFLLVSNLIWHQVGSLFHVGISIVMYATYDSLMRKYLQKKLQILTVNCEKLHKNIAKNCKKSEILLPPRLELGARERDPISMFLANNR